MQKMKKFIVILMSALLILSCSFSSFADVNDLLIATDSNAVMTLDLDDEDYGISLLNSIVNVSNTVDYSGASLWIYGVDNESGMPSTSAYPLDSDGFRRVVVRDGYTVLRYGIHLTKSSLPVSNTYRMQVAFASDLSYDYKSCVIYTYRNNSNATTTTKQATLDFSQSSGDAYVDCVIELGSLTALEIQFNLSEDMVEGSTIAGYWDINFALSSSTVDFVTAGSGMSQDDYESGVSSSLSNLSSSVDSMSEDLSSAAESLNYISTSQNLIIQGIDNVIMHISDQLYAFWDQLYNLIHLPTMSKMDEIIDAIENMDLEIEVNLDGLKSTINQMSQDVQNKLQSVQDGINNKLQSVQDTLTGGYDNTGIDQDAAELDSSLKEYDEAEQNVLDNVNDSLNDFEFDAGFDDYKTIIQTVSDFLQALYDASGGLKVLINLSMLMSIAGIVIGVYRIRGGG